MGGTQSCEKCEPASSGSVVNLSDDCVNRLTGDEEPEDNKTGETIVQQEASRIEKLRCIDDAHSVSYGLTEDNFYRLLARVEAYTKVKDTLPCARGQLISCLKKNSNCIMKCRLLMEEYIECVDMYRISKMKDALEKERRESKNQEVKNILVITPE